MNRLKIGITVGFLTNDESLWTNGIKLNILTLHHLLKKSDKNYEIKLLNTRELDWTIKPYFLKDVDICYFNDEYEDMDLIIIMGSHISIEQIIKFKSINKKNKLIGYKCSTEYLLITENILFSDKDNINISEHHNFFDEIWYIPQQHDTNSGFLHTFYRTNAVVVPFIWHHKFIYHSVIEIENGFLKGIYKKSYKYHCKKDKKTIGVMEPNLNIVKFCLIPSMIAEESYRGNIGKNKIKKLMITNSIDTVKNKNFMNIIKTFDLFNDNKIIYVPRYETSYIVSQYLDILICHQLLNPLNYIYLDVAFMGYPVLHNGTICKDIGYYYEGSDTIKAAKLLDWILENHDNNLQEYEEKNKKALYRYSADNKLLIETYDKLIYNLYNGGNHNLIYDEDINNYK